MATLILIEDLAGPAAIGRGGLAMHVLQWLHGLRSHGHQVLFVEYLDEDPGAERDAVIRYFHDCVSTWWDPLWSALLMPKSLESLYGLDARQVAAVAERADALITLAAHYQRNPYPLVEKVRPRILVEQDPGYTHLWATEGDPRDIFGEHDIYFTVGTNIGTPRCRLPTLGIAWRPIGFPIVLDWWPVGRPIQRDYFTTIADWRGYGYLEFEDQSLGPKCEEFRKFIELPGRVGEPLEIAAVISDDDPDVEFLKQHGWRLENPEVASSPARFIDYLSGSAGEFSCAKGGYVGTHSGWFSDRSSAYLAAGRPVVLQDTGFGDTLPTGKGLFAVANVEEAAEAIRAIRKDYARHSAAARDLAREFCAADQVAGRVLAAAGLN